MKSKSRLKVLSCLASIVLCASVTPSFSAMKRGVNGLEKPAALPAAVVPEPHRGGLTFCPAPKRAYRTKTKYTEYTPLIRAIMQGNFSKAIELIGRGADVDQPDYSGDTPLHAAVHEYDNPAVHTLVDMLVENMEDINAKNAKGETALTVAKANLRYVSEMKEDSGIKSLERIIKYLEEHGAVDPLDGVLPQPIHTIKAGVTSSSWFSGSDVFGTFFGTQSK